MNKFVVGAVMMSAFLTSCTAPVSNINSNVAVPTNVNVNTNTAPATASGSTLHPSTTQDPTIRVTMPTQGATVPKTLTVTGQASTWYFEASFPLKVVDDSGKVLFEGPLTAQGDWMTTAFVPFKGEVTLEQPTTKTGKFIFQKSNPSGMPENDHSFEVPVVFGF